MIQPEYALNPIGVLRSTLTRRQDAPRQGSEGAPDAWIEVEEAVAAGLEGIHAGDTVIVITWLHQADRGVLRTHPRNDLSQPERGVFTTRSPDRPNPIGLHRVTVRTIEGRRVQVGPIEAIDGTPALDIKPALPSLADA